MKKISAILIASLFASAAFAQSPSAAPATPAPAAPVAQAEAKAEAKAELKTESKADVTVQAKTQELKCLSCPASTLYCLFSVFPGHST